MPDTPLTADQIMALGSPTQSIDYGLSGQIATLANQNLSQGMSADDALSAAVKKYNPWNGFSVSFEPTSNSFVGATEPSQMSGPMSAEQMLGLPAPSPEMEAAQLAETKKRIAAKTALDEANYQANTPSVWGGMKDLWENTIIPRGKKALTEIQEHPGRAVLESGILGPTVATLANPQTRQDIKNSYLQGAAAIHNWSQTHETVPEKPLTQDQWDSAKLIGLVPDNMSRNPSQEDAEGYMVGKRVNGNTSLSWNSDIGWTLGTTLKTSPETAQKLADAYAKAHGGNLANLRENIEKSKDPTSTDFDPTALLLGSWPILTDLANPNLKTTQLQDTLEIVTWARHVSASPDKYGKDQVAQANNILSYWKEQKGRGAFSDLGDFLKMVASNPLGMGKGLLASTVEQPEFLAAGGGGDLGMAAKSAKSLETAAQALKMSEITKAATGARSAMMDERAEQAMAAAQKATAAGKLLRPVTGAAIGAGINTIAQNAQQDTTEGYRHGQMGAAVTGAVLGGVLGGLHGRSGKPVVETPPDGAVIPSSGGPEASPTQPKAAPAKPPIEPETETVPSAEDIQTQLERRQPSVSVPSAQPAKVSGGAEVPSSQTTSASILPEVTSHTIEKFLPYAAGVGLGATGVAMSEGRNKSLTDMGLAGLGLVAALFLGRGVHADFLDNLDSAGFVGRRAKNWSLADEAAANRLDREGVSPEKIHAAYGLQKVPGGGWQRAMSDKQTNLYLSKAEHSPDGGAPYNDVVSGSSLQRAYPELADKLYVQYKPKEELGNSSGYYDDTKKEIVLARGLSPLEELYTIIHEGQHAIQKYEGWPEGISSVYYAERLVQLRDNLTEKARMYRAAADRAVADGNVQRASVFSKKAQDLLEHPSARLSDADIDKISHQMYLDTYGEEQARTAELHAHIADSDLRQLPWIDIGREGSPHYLIRDSQVSAHSETGKTNIHPQEKDLVEGAKRGDPKAIAALYNHYKPIMVRTIAKMLNKNGRPNIGPKLGEDAEDIVNHVFHKILTPDDTGMSPLEKFKGESSFYTWLHRSVVNHTLNEITRADRLPDQVSIFKGTGRDANELSTEGATTIGEGRIIPQGKASSGLRSEVDEQPVEGMSPEDELVNKQLGKQLREALAKMPEDIRRALIDHDIHGMTYQEIADKEGIQRPAAFKRVERGHAIGRSLLGGKQAGSTTIDGLLGLMKYGILPIGGAIFGMHIASEDHKVKGAFLGAVAALMLANLGFREHVRNLKILMSHPTHFNVNELTGAYDTIISSGAREAAKMITKVKTLVPKREDRVAMTHWREGDHSIPMSANQKLALSEIDEFFHTYGQVGQSLGVFGELLPNFVPHEWVTDKGDWTRHNVKRKIATYQEGIARGLTPITMDMADLIAIYSRDTSLAFASKYLTQNLKHFSLGMGPQVAMMPTEKAPYDYRIIDHPSMRGFSVHPDIAPSLEFIYHNQYGNLGEAIAVLNSSIKRVTFGFSLFHPFTLGLVHLTANPYVHVLRSLKEIGQSVAGKTEMQKMYLQGGYGDRVHLAQKAGVMITAKKGGTVIDQDMNNGLHEGLQKAQEFLAKIPMYGNLLAKGIKGVDWAFRLQDKFVWENVHAGLKLQTFSHMFDKAKLNHLRLAEKDPTYKVPSDLEIATQVGKVVNDLYGGLNWRRTMDEANTQAGKVLAYALNNPKSRQIFQVAVFAPDWTESTIRATVGSLPQSMNAPKGVEGLLHQKMPQDFYRWYNMRNMILYFGAYNIVNMAITGHPIWQNRTERGEWDPFDIQLGNGETIQPNKHFFETPNLVMEPKSWLLNKIGPVPKEVIEQLMGLEYLSASGHSPPMKTNPLLHALEMYTPISVESWQKQGKWSAVLSLIMQVKHQATADEIAARRAAARRKRNSRNGAHVQSLIGD